MKVNKVTWEVPQQGQIKYNTDEVSRDNPIISSYAFCLRNEQDDLLYAKGANIEETANVEVEAIAIFQVATHYSQLQHSKVIIQIDPLTMQKILNREQGCPQSLSDTIEQIWTFMKDKQVQYQYILRDGNQLADYLANFAIDKGNFIFTNFQQL